MLKLASLAQIATVVKDAFPGTLNPEKRALGSHPKDFSLVLHKQMHFPIGLPVLQVA